MIKRSIRYTGLRKGGISVLLLLLLVCLIPACTGRMKKVEHRQIIPKDKFIEIMTDIYLTDGLLSYPKVNNWMPRADSLSTYYHVVESHGYTMADLEGTIRLYYIKRPKQLIKIYDNILGNLSEMDSQLEKAALEEQSQISNLWRGKAFYSVSDGESALETRFDLKCTMAGIYTITFVATVFPGDQSSSPRPEIYKCSPGIIPEEADVRIPVIPYIRDGIPHVYSIRVNVDQPVKIHIRGALYSCSNNADIMFPMAFIHDIIVTYAYGMV